MRLLGGLDFGPGRDVPGSRGRLAAGRRRPTRCCRRRGRGGAGRACASRATSCSTRRPASSTPTRRSTALLRPRAGRRCAGATRRDGDRGCADTRGPAGRRLDAGRRACVVVAAGGWAGPLLGGVVDAAAAAGDPAVGVPLPAPRPGGAAVAERRSTSTAAARSITSPAGATAARARTARSGCTTAGRCVAAGRPGVVDPAARADLVDYVRRWLPGLDPRAARRDDLPVHAHAVRGLPARPRRQRGRVLAVLGPRRQVRAADRRVGERSRPRCRRRGAGPLPPRRSCRGTSGPRLPLASPPLRSVPFRSVGRVAFSGANFSPH